MGDQPVSAQRLRDITAIRRVRDRIDREYARPLNVEELARDAYMSAGHLSREFRRIYQESPYSYLMTRRIERAMTLLRSSDLSVTGICFAVGFSSLVTFSTRFSELVGVAPSIYLIAAIMHKRPPEFRHAWQNRSPDRSGIKKRTPPDHF